MKIDRPKGVECLRNTLTRPLGLEIELVNHHSLMDSVQSNQLNHCKWDWVRDGSVPDGQEMVLYPLVGDKYLSAMEELIPTILEYGAEVNSTCGLHVHVGADDLSMFEIRSLLLGYHRIQNDIYKLVDADRYDARYCRVYTTGQLVPLWNAKTEPTIKAALTQLLYAKPCDVNIVAVKREKYQAARYYGLNIHSWHLRGTIEWRHHQGTLDPSKLINWPLFCGWMTEILSSLNDQELVQLNSLADVTNGVFKRKFSTLAMPDPIAEWVKQTIRN